MLKQIRKPKNNRGFTIIEIMIVLAVAALILLIVLLAVPALQRNSRNTTIKNDASSVAGAINTFESDNNGTSPNNFTGTGTVTITDNTADTNCGGTASATETISVNGSTKVTCITTAPTAQVPAGSIQVLPLTTCPTTLPATGAPSAGTGATTSARAFAIYYSIEISGGLTNECTTS